MDAKGAAPASIGDWIGAQARAMQPIQRRIHATLREEAPHAQETISNRLPAFMQGGAPFFLAVFGKHRQRVGENGSKALGRRTR
ncbi:MAG: hypothetical protein ABIP61_09770 [Burkholderiaceae bacterium]